jgi:hypothetical protein
MVTEESSFAIAVRITTAIPGFDLLVIFSCDLCRVVLAVGIAIAAVALAFSFSACFHRGGSCRIVLAVGIAAARLRRRFRCYLGRALLVVLVDVVVGAVTTTRRAIIVVVIVAAIAFLFFHHGILRFFSVVVVFVVAVAFSLGRWWRNYIVRKGTGIPLFARARLLEKGADPLGSWGQCVVVLDRPGEPALGGVGLFLAAKEEVLADRSGVLVVGLDPLAAFVVIVAVAVAVIGSIAVVIALVVAAAAVVPESNVLTAAATVGRKGPLDLFQPRRNPAKTHGGFEFLQGLRLFDVLR